MRKTIAVLLSVLCFTAGISGAGMNVSGAEQFSPAVRTQQEIREYVSDHSFDVTAKVNYAVTPVAESPYVTGELDSSSLNDALNALNVIRYIAGLDEVALNPEYCHQAQAASLVNAANNRLSHSPEQPSDMSDALYQTGKNGCSSSNLGMGHINPADSVIYGYMEDASGYNLSCLGHRRWCLNPTMKEVGFGQVKRYTAMYAFDNYEKIYDSIPDITGISWPAHNTPVEYFSNGVPWSYSVGTAVPEDVSVTLTNNQDGKIWTFSNNHADGQFFVNNQPYGQPGCIIFLPEDLTVQDGESFHVQISGLKQEISYDVQFFSVTTPETPEVKGDLNQDNIVNIYDYCLMKKGILYGFSEETISLVDMNSDNAVNVADLIFMQKFLHHRK